MSHECQTCILSDGVGFCGRRGTEPAVRALAAEGHLHREGRRSRPHRSRLSRTGIWKAGRSGSGRMACPCSPASPHVLTPQTPDSRSQHRGEWRPCTPGTPRGLGAAVSSPGRPATYEPQDRVTPRAHSPLHPGTGGPALPASTVPPSEKQRDSRRGSVF